MNEVIAALIAAAVSLLVNAVVNIRKTAQFFSNTVSMERMAWIKEMRDLSAKMLSVCERCDPAQLPDEQYDAFLNARNGILIRLNPVDTNYPHDKALHRLLAEPDFAAIKANVPEIRYQLGAILKTEWEKVKVEAGNSPWKIRQVDTLREKIAQRRADEPQN